MFVRKSKNVKFGIMILSVFNKPYPLRNEVFLKLKIAIIISFFVAAFLLVLQPFGLYNYMSLYKTIIILGYGFVCFFILLINLIVLPALLKIIFIEDRWKVKSHIFYQLWILFTIGVGNFFYTAIVFEFKINWNLFIAFQLFTLIVGSFPVIIITLVSQNNLLKNNIKLAASLNSIIKNDAVSDDKEFVEIKSESKNENLKIVLTDLLYIKSQGNYVQVLYIQNEEIKSELLRITLTKVESEFSKFSTILRCHRAFIVNLNRIENVDGNSQGYRLKLQNSKDIIPVSRGYLDSFNHTIRKS
jgi:hypothetical protein